MGLGCGGLFPTHLPTLALCLSPAESGHLRALPASAVLRAMAGVVVLTLALQLHRLRGTCPQGPWASLPESPALTGHTVDAVSLPGTGQWLFHLPTSVRCHHGWARAGTGTCTRAAGTKPAFTGRLGPSARPGRLSRRADASGSPGGGGEGLAEKNAAGDRTRLAGAAVQELGRGREVGPTQA